MRTILVVAVGLLLVAAAALMVGRWNRARGQVVIGRELAKAQDAERQRLQAGGQDPSPLPAKEYDVWRGELSLLDPVPVPLDGTLAQICRTLVREPASRLARVRRAISMDQFYTLLTFGSRAAVFAMRQRSVEQVRDGLNAMALIELERIDFRDIGTPLSLLHHAATRIGADANALFQEAAAVAEPAVAKRITDFARQVSNLKDHREAWLHHEVQTDGGIGLIEWGFREYRATIDLAAVAVDLATLLGTDQYLADSVEVATEMPGIWLRADDNSVVAGVLRRVLGAASVSGKLRPSAHQAHESQMLLVMVVELPADADPRTLLEVTQQIRREDYSVLGVADGRLFCLIVGRSFVQGIASFETTETLRRFAPGIQSILARYRAP